MLRRDHVDCLHFQQVPQQVAVALVADGRRVLETSVSVFNRGTGEVEVCCRDLAGDLFELLLDLADTVQGACGGEVLEVEFVGWRQKFQDLFDATELPVLWVVR